MQLQKIKWRYTAIAYVKILEADIDDEEVELSADEVWREFVADFILCVSLKLGVEEGDGG